MQSTEALFKNEAHVDFALARMARSTLAQGHLATIGAIEVYQVSAGWQYEVLRDDPMTRAVDSLEGLNSALADETIEAILVAKNRNFAQEQAEILLGKSVQVKKIFWEI